MSNRSMSKTVDLLVERHGKERENLLPILTELQAASGDNSLHAEDLNALAAHMDLPVSEIVATASFYTMFSLTPRGRHIIRVCESPPCYIQGSTNVVEAIEARLGIRMGDTTQDGLFTLEYTSCLGACGVAPVMMIDDEVYGNLTTEKVMDILDDRIEKASRS